MQVLATVDEMSTVFTLVTSLMAGVFLLVERVRHRSHLGHVEQLHRRLHRLSTRLSGCVVELDGMLGEGLAPAGPGELPGEVAGQAHYLYALRMEHEDVTASALRHAARSTARQFLATTAPSSRRCTAAHDAVCKASAAFFAAATLYEEGFVARLQRGADSPEDVLLSSPVRLVPASRLTELLNLRAEFEKQMRVAALHFVGSRPELEQYRCAWPVLRSELAGFGQDPYRGEIRPMSRSSFGSEPILHPAAR